MPADRGAADCNGGGRWGGCSGRVPEEAAVLMSSVVRPDQVCPILRNLKIPKNSVFNKRDNTENRILGMCLKPHNTASINRPG